MPVMRVKNYAKNASLYAQADSGRKKTRRGRVGLSVVRCSGHENGNERQQEDQQAADNGDDDRNVFDHGFCRIDGGLFVVSRHGVSPNACMAAIVAKTDPGLIWIRRAPAMD